MGLVLTLLTPADYVTTKWSGGATTQLAISPANAVYADRDFLWRVSSATVETEESDFTPLPDYRRFISTLEGDMTLSHNGGARLTLHPYAVHAFDGGDDTHSLGRCRDFNLMLRKDIADGDMRSLTLPAGRSAFEPDACAESALLFCAAGACEVSCGAQRLALKKEEAVLLAGAGGAKLTLDCAEPSVLMVTQAWSAAR